MTYYYSVDNQSSEQILHRPSSAFQRLMLWAAVPGALLCALWITAGRALFGAGGSLVGIFAISFGPALLAILGVAAWWMWHDAKRYEGSVGTTSTLAVLQLVTWAIAFIFGMLCPDVVDGKTVSAASKILGEDFIGLSAGFGNTSGILTFVAAFSVFFVAWGENRRSRKRAAGVSEEDEELIARQYSEYEFLDEME
ncbi:hypothetical protein [uncultured Rothia sp.]|uniref:hypothetical protein n=1 Tax=uncultured Rothia sp. TaxID=316088 RepID=UPI0011A99DB4